MFTRHHRWWLKNNSRSDIHQQQSTIWTNLVWRKDFSLYLQRNGRDPSLCYEHCLDKNTKIFIILPTLQSTLFFLLVENKCLIVLQDLCWSFSNLNGNYLGCDLLRNGVRAALPLIHYIADWLHSTNTRSSAYLVSSEALLVFFFLAQTW